jgi:hypothetical protein
MATPSNLSVIQNYQVRTGAEMKSFISAVKTAIEQERGGALDNASDLELSRMGELLTMGRGAGTPEQIAPLFGQLRDFASGKGAPLTSAAVVSAAKWFWCNVEDPAACQAASRSTSLIPTGGGTPEYARQTLLTKKQKQMVLYVGVPVLLTGIGLYFILRD